MEIEKIFNELENIKEEIANAKQEKDQKTGQLSEQMKTLSSFKVKNIIEGKKKITTLQKKEKTLGNKIVSNFGKLQEVYEW